MELVELRAFLMKRRWNRAECLKLSGRSWPLQVLAKGVKLLRDTLLGKFWRENGDWKELQTEK